MTTTKPMTIEWGTWSTYMWAAETLEDAVVDAIDDYADRIDRDTAIERYRSVLAEALPPGMTLDGSVFLGPSPRPYDHVEIIQAAIAAAEADLLFG